MTQIKRMYLLFSDKMYRILNKSSLDDNIKSYIKQPACLFQERNQTGNQPNLRTTKHDGGKKKEKPNIRITK